MEHSVSLSSHDVEMAAPMTTDDSSDEELFTSISRIGKNLNASDFTLFVFIRSAFISHRSTRNGGRSINNNSLRWKREKTPLIVSSNRLWWEIWWGHIQQANQKTSIPIVTLRGMEMQSTSHPESWGSTPKTQPSLTIRSDLKEPKVFAIYIKHGCTFYNDVQQ